MVPDGDTKFKKFDPVLGVEIVHVLGVLPTDREFVLGSITCRTRLQVQTAMLDVNSQHDSELSDNACNALDVHAATLDAKSQLDCPLDGA